MPSALGLHHVTAIASDPQRNLDFYAGVLGLRLVKRTVNFDDPQTYHFYFGDEVGTPGSIMTFFPWPGARGGQTGRGQVSVTSFTIRPGSVGFWLERLLRHGIRYEGPTKRGAGADTEQVLAFRDPDGLMLELVGHPGAESRPAWGGAPGIGAEHAIHGFHAATLWVELRREGSRLWLRIADDGQAPALLREGNGLAGIRERVAAVGGDLRIGRGVAGNLELTVEFPS